MQTTRYNYHHYHSTCCPCSCSSTTCSIPLYSVSDQLRKLSCIMDETEMSCAECVVLHYGNYKGFPSRSGLTWRCPFKDIHKHNGLTTGLFDQRHKELVQSLSGQSCCNPIKSERPWPHLGGRDPTSPGRLLLGDFIRHGCHYRLSGSSVGGEGVRSSIDNNKWWLGKRIKQRVWKPIRNKNRVKRILMKYS